MESGENDNDDDETESSLHGLFDDDYDDAAGEHDLIYPKCSFINCPNDSHKRHRAGIGRFGRVGGVS
jgi:hypothetical protein